MKNDEKIMKNILESFKDKLVSKNQLERAFRDVLQDKYSENRKTVVGLTSKSSSETKAAQEAFVSTKERVSNTIKEYLAKAGHNKALHMMSQY